MSALDVLTLFGAMAILAGIPSVSVLAVSTRAAAHGFLHGAAVTLGIVVADALFIALATLGLAALADAMGDAFIVIKVLGGVYMIVLGIVLWRSRPRSETRANPENASHLASFLSGLALTLGDQKAIFFYLGFLPAFVDLATVSALDIVVIILVATLAVGGVKLIYAYAAAKAGAYAGGSMQQRVNKAAGAILVAVGVALLLRR